MRVEQGQKRVRAYRDGQVVADTTRPLLVWERPQFPAYYIPRDDVRTDLLGADAAAPTGEAAQEEALRDAVRLDWNAMDAWFEEDEEVFGHPRNPYSRIDILQSSRHARVEVDGEVIAESDKPTLLFETGLRVRTYFPKPHVNMDLLVPSDRTSICPYKGFASYWSLRTARRVHPDLAWSYPTPLPESERIAGLVCFYDERSTVIVEGVSPESG